MKLLSVLLEDEGMQSTVQANEGQILEAAQVYETFPQELKSHMESNLENFMGADVQETYSNMKSFVEGAVFQLLHELSDGIAVA